VTFTRRRQLAASVVVAVLVTTALIAASVLGSRSDGEAAADTTEITALSGEASLLSGIPQNGTALGSPHAPVTLVEYADLQCPYCAQWARNAFPELVRDYVRTGRVRMVFRGLVFIGPDSDKALRTALAAAEQRRFWDVLHLLFANQGPENAGWVTEDMLTRIGTAVQGLDDKRMLDGRWSPRVDSQLAAAAASAERDGVTGTPAFMAGPTGGKLEPVAVASLDAAPFRAHLDGLLAAR
jgi:protein-disulfide isomerase